MRRYLSLRALGLGAVGLVLIAIMVGLGRWQLGVYDAHQQSEARARLHETPVALDRLLGPDEPFPAQGVGRPVTVSGRFLADQQVYVRNMHGAASAYAVATPLLTRSGSAILVVRGSVSTLVAPAPTGPVTVQGVLEPSSSAGPPPGPHRVVDRLSVAGLVGSVRPDLYSGYVVMRSSTPEQHPALDSVVPPTPTPSRWSGVRNLLYAFQWWVFAGFVAFMWWRIVRDLPSGPAVRATERPAGDAGSDSLSPLR